MLGLATMSEESRATRRGGGFPASNLAQVSGDSINCDVGRESSEDDANPADSSECEKRQHGLLCPN